MHGGGRRVERAGERGERGERAGERGERGERTERAPSPQFARRERENVSVIQRHTPAHVYTQQHPHPPPGKTLLTFLQYK